MISWFLFFLKCYWRTGALQCCVNLCCGAMIKNIPNYILDKAGRKGVLVGGNVDWGSHCGEQHGVSLKN